MGGAVWGGLRDAYPGRWLVPIPTHALPSNDCPRTPRAHPAGTLAAVWLRLEALKACVRLKVSLGLNMRLALKEMMGGGGGQGAAGGTR